MKTAKKEHDTPPAQKQIAAPETSNLDNTGASTALVPANGTSGNSIATMTDAAALAELMSQADADEGVGTDYNSNELAAPYLKVLQGLSPEAKDGEPTYIEGAKIGMVFNTVTKKVYDTRIIQGRPEPEGIYVVFAHGCRSMVVEWKPDRGGFVAHHEPGSRESVGKRTEDPSTGKIKTINAVGNELIDTHYHFPLICDDPSDPKPAILPMVSTQQKVSRDLNSLISDLKIDGRKRPIYFHVFALKTKLQQKGTNTWWGWVVQYRGSVADAFGAKDGLLIFNKAKKYFGEIEAGTAKMTPPPSDAAEPDAENAPF